MTEPQRTPVTHLLTTVERHVFSARSGAASQRDFQVMQLGRGESRATDVRGHSEFKTCTGTRSRFLCRTTCRGVHEPSLDGGGILLC